MKKPFHPLRAGVSRLPWLWLLLILPIVGDPLTAWAQGPLYAVLISHRVTNVSDAPLEDVTAVCILPATSRYQEVVGFQVDPEPSETRSDLHEQPIITVPLGTIPPGQTRAVRALVWARLRAVRVNLLGPGGKPTTLPADVEAGQLGDGYLLQLDKIRPLAEKHAGTQGSALDRAAKAYEYMVGACVYDIDERFEPADRVLAGSPASCTELAYTYVALCRALGVPARIVSAYANREGTAPSTDWRTHRWAEFYSQTHGWVPADPTNRLNNSSKTFFGHQDGRYLTVIDDGVASDEGPDPAWHVFAATSSAGRKALALSRSAVWRVSTSRRSEAGSFAKACAVLRSGRLDERREAAAAWPRQRDTLVHAWLLEAMFDPDRQIRRDAATALGGSSDESMLIPLALTAADEPDTEAKTAMLGAARQLLATPDPEQRAQAVAELARSRTPEALTLLAGTWNDPAREVRKAAAQSLYKFGDKPLVHEGYRLLVNDADDYIRAIAALRWARTGTRDPEPFLVDLLDSSVRWDREQALAELKRRSGDDFDFDPSLKPQRKSNQEAMARWLQWLDRPEPAQSPAEPAPSSAHPAERTVPAGEIRIKK